MQKSLKSLDKAIDAPSPRQIHIYTKHFHAVYFITLEVYYFTGMGYEVDNSNELYLFFCFMRMCTKFNGNAWKNGKISNVLTKTGMNFSFIQRRVSVRKLL